MKTVFKVLVVLICISLLIFIEIFSLEDPLNLWPKVGQTLSYFAKNQVESRTKDYEEFYNKYLKWSNTPLGDDMSFFSENQEGIHIIESKTSSWWEISLTGNDWYILLKQPWSVYKVNDVVGFWYTTKILGSDWIIVAPCTRLVCSEDRFYK